MPYSGKNWTLTMWPDHKDFDMSDEQYDDIQNLSFARYIIMGEEICPKTKQKHVHVYCETKEKSDMKEMKLRFGGKTTHCERTKDIGAYVKYCKKDGKFVEFGKRSTPGQRNDLESLKKDIDDGKSVKEIADNNFGQWCRNYRAIDRYMSMIKQPQRKVSEVIVIYGPPGTGKSTLAKELAKYDAYEKTPDLDWWDGYEDQKTVIMDEFRGQHMKISSLLKFLDSGTYRVNIKGVVKSCQAEQIIIVSNYHPTKWYFDIDETSQKALNRRITRLIKRTKVFNNGGELPAEEEL